MTEDYKCTTVQVLPPHPPVTDMLTVMYSAVVTTILLNIASLIMSLVKEVRLRYAGAEKTSSQKRSQKS